MVKAEPFTQWVIEDWFAGERPDFGDSLLAWDTRTGTLAIFGFVLLVLEMLWGRATLVIFAVSFDGMPDLKGLLLALLEPENIGFIEQLFDFAQRLALGLAAVFCRADFCLVFSHRVRRCQRCDEPAGLARRAHQLAAQAQLGVCRHLPDGDLENIVFHGFDFAGGFANDPQVAL